MFIKKHRAHWPDLMTVELIRLHKKGFSFGQIARQMHMSRQAVSGKIFRLKKEGIIE